MNAKKPLSETHPEVAAQWHPSKNGNLKPDDVTYGMRKNVWWICDNGHEWCDTIGHRSRGRG
ncbi:MAG: zinc-ribbon domain-containing protein [Candidatus Aegiribacteria sp.]|nr:zinc-ribbon domain-containing protein [Candidatus Aegiribacteria sp.]